MRSSVPKGRSPRFVSLGLPTIQVYSEQTAAFHDPAIEGRMVNWNTALGNDLLEITAGYCTAITEKHGVHDHVLWKMSALECDHERNANLI